MRSFRIPTLVVAAFGLAACGPYSRQPGVQPFAGDDALRTHGHGIRAPLVPEPGVAEIPLADTAAIAAARNRDSLAAAKATANRARIDSVEQARLAALAAANRTRTDSLEQARLATLTAASRTRTDSLEQAHGALRAELAELIHFDVDQAELQPADRAILNRKAAILEANPAVHVRVAGYCDARGSDKYNLALGTRRAAAAKQYLIGRGIDADRLDTVSQGSASPLDPGQNEIAWAKNRRAEFEITRGGDTLTTPVALR